eukprot:8104901-Ditylum_brightwellii.AAC.1
MLQKPDRDEFEAAMEKEVQHMFGHEVWEKVPRSEMLEYYTTLRRMGIDVKRKQLMLIWSFKRKRHADGTLSKHNARLCCHGGQQQWGLNFYETYAPVVRWASVRTMMVMSKIYHLNTRSINFALAYPQAAIKTKIYLFLAAGIIINVDGKDMVLKLKKNIYGFKDVDRTWWEHLSAGLESMGFKQCNSDQCVWKRE